MKKLIWLGGVVATLALVGMLASNGQAADHDDVPLAAGNPMADITDVYAWVSGSNLELVMNVSPQDDGTHSFDPSVLYVFHLTSKPTSRPDSPGGTETRVICRFASNVSVQCWVVDSDGSTKDFVTGDPSNPAGVTSMLGKLRVFAGRRSDPSSFNASGFNAAIERLNELVTTTPGVLPDPAGCPSWLPSLEAEALRNMLRTGSDSFATSNVMAMVVRVDKLLVNTGGNTVVAVWGSTHAVQ